MYPQEKIMVTLRLYSQCTNLSQNYLHVWYTADIAVERQKQNHYLQLQAPNGIEIVGTICTVQEWEIAMCNVDVLYTSKKINYQLMKGCLSQRLV